MAFQKPLMWQRFDMSTEFLFGQGGSPRVQPGTDWLKVWKCFISCSIPYQHVVQHLSGECCSAFVGSRHHNVTGLWFINLPPGRIQMMVQVGMGDFRIVHRLALTIRFIQYLAAPYPVGASSVSCPCSTWFPGVSPGVPGHFSLSGRHWFPESP